MEDQPSPQSNFPQGELHRLLRQAAACGLPDAVLVTGHALLRHVPGDAARPVSPARVQDLAEERGCDPRTIRSHIRRLEACGLAEDCSAGGGRRMIRRRRGRIVVLQGIDFTPMLEQAEAFALAALEAEAERDERRQLAARVSELKRKLRDAVAGDGSECLMATARAALDACPARHRALSLRDLAALAGRLVAAVRLLTDREDAAGGRILLPDRTAQIVRADTTEKDEIPVCKPHAPDGAGTDGALGPISPDLLAAALPFDWRVRMEATGFVSRASLIATARERAGAIGIGEDVWAEAQGALGRAGAAVVVLLADAGSIERGGPIRCPAAWVRAMTTRSASQPLRLHRNLLSLLQRQRGKDGPAPCPATVAAPSRHPTTTRSPCPVS